MGCFDTINFSCPSCAAAMHVQSKGGQCLMKNYHSSSVPMDVAGYVVDEILECPSCHLKWAIGPRRVSIRLEAAESEYD